MCGHTHHTYTFFMYFCTYTFMRHNFLGGPGNVTFYLTPIFSVIVEMSAAKRLSCCLPRSRF